MARKPHHSGSYVRDSAALRAAAYADPHTRCWRCHLTLTQCTNRDGKPARWTAGHLNDGQIGGPLAPECGRCNYAAGARRGNGMRHQAIAGHW